MNKLNGVIKNIKSCEGISRIALDVNSNSFIVLVLGDNEEYQLNQKINLLFKETEVMIATKESKISARNSFVSTVTAIEAGEILAQVEFDFCQTKIVSVVTKDALLDLKCNVGDEFRWFVKSNEVSILKV